MFYWDYDSCKMFVVSIFIETLFASWICAFVEIWSGSTIRFIYCKLIKFSTEGIYLSIFYQVKFLGILLFEHWKWSKRTP